jgi:predicted RNA binding protein YcfA (HicA-like mRNA interferase family)
VWVTTWYNQVLGREADRAERHGMKVRDVLRLLADDGWVQVSQRGSHRQLEHPTKPGKVTVAGKMSDDLPTGTLRSILRQAGLRG